MYVGEGLTISEYILRMSTSSSLGRLSFILKCLSPVKLQVQ
jgi:hypothetical protein